MFILDSKNLGEIVGSVATIISASSTLFQTIHCIRKKSGTGISWSSLKTKILSISLFALSTFLYGGPFSMFIGNLFTLSNTLIIVGIKWKEERKLNKPLKSKIIFNGARVP